LAVGGQLEDDVWRSIVADWSRNLESRNQILSGPILTEATEAISELVDKTRKTENYYGNLMVYWPVPGCFRSIVATA
jgi:hypothetical protein